MERNNSGTEARRDNELLDKTLAGDKDARYELAVLTSKLIYRYTYDRAQSVGLHFSRQDVQDFNQDLLISLFQCDCRKLRGFKRKSSFARWLYVVVTNALIDRKRSLANRLDEDTESLQARVSSNPDAPTLEELLPDLASNPKEQLLYKSLVESVRKAKDEVLTKEEKLIIDLWCSRQYTEKEMSMLLDMNENTIATKIRRAQARILEYLKDKEGDSVI